MVDDSAVSQMVAELEQVRPAARAGIFIAPVKGPNAIELRGTKSGLQALAAVLLRASLAPFPASSESHSILKYLTAHRDKLDWITSDHSRLRIFGVGCFTDIESEDATAADRPHLSKAKQWLILVSWLGVLMGGTVALLLGLRDMALWLGHLGK